MPYRVLGATSATLLALSLGAQAPAQAAADSTAGQWRMNENPGATTLVDSSGNGLHGSIGADVLVGRTSGDSVVHKYPYTPPDSLPVRPGHLSVVPHHAALNPGSGDHAVSVRLRTTHGFGNIVQKGQSATTGGFFKVENNNGIITCLYRGPSGQGGVSSKQRIDDGQWHTVRCERTDDRVRMWVDGAIDDTRHTRTGSIANTWPLSIAGKTSCNQTSVGCDYFVGHIDYVRIETGAESGSDGHTVQLASDFSSGLSSWSGVKGLTIDTSRSSRNDGTPSLRAQVEGGAGMARLNLAAAADDVCAEVDVRAARVAPAAPYSLMKLRNRQGSSVARVRVDSEGRVSGRADRAGRSFSTGATVQSGRWHRLGLCVAVGESGAISLMVDGSRVGSWTGNTGRSPVAAVQLGDNSARTATVNWDHLHVTSTSAG